jgi:hypothetical protein
VKGNQLFNYRVGITCADPTILQILAGLLQGPECKIAVENGEYYWSSSFFETSQSGGDAAKKADQYLPALNGLVKLLLATASNIMRSNKILFTNETGGIGAFLEGSVSIQVTYSISAGEKEQEKRRQRWAALVSIWVHQVVNPSDALNSALTQFGEEMSWHSLYNTYEIIREAYNCSQGEKDKRTYRPLPEQWTVMNGRNREKDFTESANNAYISGIGSARHPLAASLKAEKIEDSLYIEVTKGNGKKECILPMSLHEAKEFVAHILIQWIESNQVSPASE